MVKELKLSDHVIFQTDTIDYDKLIGLYKSATLFVFPTREDSLGVVILEALHSRLPVIATSVGGIPDMIKEGINGLLVKPDNPEELSKAIALLLRNNVLRETFRKNAATILKEKYYKNRITLADSLQQSVDAVLTKK
jgi:glycosyltransferase involved in cell wall biosynthesis